VSAETAERRNQVRKRQAGRNGRQAGKTCRTRGKTQRQRKRQNPGIQNGRQAEIRWQVQAGRQNPDQNGRCKIQNPERQNPAGGNGDSG